MSVPRTLVTGSSSGIGRLTAMEVARRGHRVFATMRDIDGRNGEAAAELRRFATDGSFSLQVVELDVTSEASVTAAIDLVTHSAGGLDVLINNAGALYLGVAEAFTPEQFRAQLEVNLVGPFRVARAVLPAMRAARAGLIVHVSSIAGRFAYPQSALYIASKFGLEGLVEAWRYETAAFGVEQILVQPGPFKTGIPARLTRPADDERAEPYSILAPVEQAIGARFEELLADPATTDPQQVADAIADLIAQPAGSRPLRTVVGLDFGVARALDAAYEPLRRTGSAELGFARLDDLGEARNLSD